MNYLTEREILDTPEALKKTYGYLTDCHEKVAGFFASTPSRKFVFMGCGSSYMLAKGAAALFDSLPDTTARAIPAGDYIVDPEFWKETVHESIVVALSRSGKTSEMVRAIRHMKNTRNVRVISISMQDQNDIMPMSDLDLTLDWCYDNSVCQTRTVTNLYAASVLLAAYYTNDEGLEKSVKTAIETSRAFENENLAKIEEMAGMDWENVVVLADGPVTGIAEEGALAFTEISMLTGRYFHLLDYRHGPIVISGEKTLTLALLRPGEEALQNAMVQDVVKHGGVVATVSQCPAPHAGEKFHFQIRDIPDFEAWGIPFVFIAQMTAFKKAIALGGNPDAPTGLDAYITLK